MRPGPMNAPKPRHTLPKLLSGLILLVGVWALKAKGVIVLLFEKIRVL